MTNHPSYIPVKKLAIALGACILVLVVAHVAGQYYKNFISDDGSFLRVIDKFDLDLERNNLPTWYQSSTLLMAAFLTCVIAFVRRIRQEAVFSWVLISIVFAFLSMDEAVSIHEQLTVPLREAFDLNGFFFLSWVIPGAIVAIAFLAMNLKFLIGLPRATRRLFIIGGIVYLSGALVMEMIDGSYLQSNHFIATNPEITGMIPFKYALLVGLEELLEMTGIAIFLHAVGAHLNLELSSYGRDEASASAGIESSETAILPFTKLPANGKPKFRAARV